MPRGSAVAASGPVRPGRAELAAAYGRTIPDLIAPGLDVLFCGINPGLYSAAIGRHFGRPGNRFWPALHRGGFTPRLLGPTDQEELLGLGLGITDLVERATARADELTPAELALGGRRLRAKVRRYRPAWVAVVGVTAYRVAFDRRGAALGHQPDGLGGAGLWVLPNPSGLNAHYTPDRLAGTFAELRAVVLAGRGGPDEPAVDPDHSGSKSRRATVVTGSGPTASV
ncbi:G/U mismatch-specific DNA glycosylase [Micromonospora sp. NBC_01699]|uniref:G/U mismatch-specific DNA glycosylase n=1 Tax=Micromonospora sp. NBC_01699 TaxID=2975984 RepID=UPI002E2A62AB|nr:G/U mismatch-specific DNA glycosylase [Micromonospora sp. NBC_01699]